MARLTHWADVLVRWALGLVALWVVLLALYVSLGRQLVPLVAEYDHDVSAKASEVLGQPVAIGRLEGRWVGMAPVIVAREVTVGEGAHALRLDRVRVVPDIWASLLARKVHIAHLEVDGLQLTLQEDAQGHWALEGLPKRDDSPFDPAQALEGLKQLGQFSLLDSQLTLIPYQHDPLTLTYIGASLRSTGGHERADLRMTLPDGQPLAASLTALVDAADWRRSDLQAYLSLPQADWAKWLPPQLSQGWNFQAIKAGGEFWLDWRQQALRNAVVRLNAPEVRGSRDGKPVQVIKDLALNAWARQDGDQLTVQADTLAMTLGETRWASRLLARRQTEGADGQTWHLEADRLDLTPLTPLVDAFVPLPEQAALAVNALKPTGGLRNILLGLRPQVTGDRRLSFAANLDDVGFSAYHGAPGAGHVSGQIEGDLGQGTLNLNTPEFMLHLTPIFEKPWFYHQARAQLKWRLNDEGFTLVAPVIKVVGDEGDIGADFLIRLPFDHHREPYMDLRVGLLNGDGRYTSKYLPEVLSPALTEWLSTAIHKGTVDEGYFQYQGSLAHAAPDHSRSISLFFKVRDAELAFQPGWPAAKNVSGNVYIQDGAVKIDADHGQILDTQVSDVSVTVPHVPAGQPSHLFVDGAFDGLLKDGVNILQTAPIGTEKIFAGWEAEGPLVGRVKLDIPLEKGPEPGVIVDFSTQNARLKIAEPVLEFTRLGGKFRFDLAKGLSGQGITAQALGRPLSAQIFAEGKPGEPLTRIAAKGQMTVKTLTDWLKFNHPIPASGDIPYNLQVKLGKTSSLSVDSDLTGVTVDLPAPFGKEASDARAAHFEMGLEQDKLVRADYAGLASFAFMAPNGTLANGRGELMLGGEVAQLPPQPGLQVRGVLDSLELAPWQRQAGNYASGEATGSAKQFLSGVDLRVGQLTGFGVTLDQARVQLARANAAWAVTLDSQQVTGKVALPDGDAPIDVDLQQVKLPPADPQVASATVEAPDPLADLDPRKVPAVNVKVLKLYQGDDLIGAWAFKLRPTASGMAINDIDLGLKGLHVVGAGSWDGSPGATSSWFKGSLQGNNLADVLKAWNFAPTATSERFSLEADGRWPGSPAWVSLKRYSGSMDATLHKGQFVEVEGGAQALRVFGLLNFNAIGRRLRLDFSDLLGRGLSYDRVKGVLAASNGVYVTRTPITLTGPSSNLELDGTLDIPADRIDAKLLVTLPVTTNLPIAALLVGAPAVGGALFLVDKLLGDRVARFASVQYRVEGPMKEPKISFDKPFEKPR